MRVSVVLGPGHHGPEVLAALRRRGWLHQAVHQYPRFLVEDGEGRALARRPLLDLSTRAAWAAWRRLPGLRRRETPRGVFAAVQGALARRSLGPCDLLIAWLQVGLEALVAARDAGTPALLEHPMNHIDHYRETLAEERRRWGRGLGGYSDFPLLIRHRMERECQVAPVISVLSSFSRRTFTEHGVAPGRLVELPLGVDHEHFSPREGRAPGPLRVVFVGRVELMKGVPYLLTALQRLKKLPLELQLVGPVADDLKPLLRRLDDPRVRYLDVTGRAALPAVYRGADVLVFPTVNDALGLVMLEAMACGVPVIATERSGGPDVIRDQLDGFVIPARDPGAIADRLATLAADPDQTVAMGRSARQRIEQYYTLAHHEGRLADLCQRLTSTPVPTSP